MINGIRSRTYFLVKSVTEEEQHPIIDSSSTRNVDCKNWSSMERLARRIWKMVYCT